MPVERTAARIRSLAAAHWQRSPHQGGQRLVEWDRWHRLLEAATSVRAILVLLALLLVPPAAEAQQIAQPRRLGWLSAGFERPDLEKGFRVRLRELGYVEGQNLVIEYRYARGNFEGLSELILNRKAANALGLTISPSLLLRADQVVE
jgi:hypothetical protein